MDRATGKALLDRFAALDDARQAAKVLYPLPEIILLLLCATLAGADDFVAIQLWGEQNLAFLRRLRPYEHGIPSHDTLGEVIRVLDPGLFKACFASWVEALREVEPDLIAVDGKTSRRTHARRHGREPLHLVSAWASRQRLVLGQGAVAGASNEITAIPLLLARLELAGALVTIDAIGTQDGIAGAILSQGGDYLLALKANRPATLADVAAFFADPPPGMVETVETVDGDHGRIAVRRHAVCHETSPGCSPTAAIPARSPSPASPRSAWSRPRSSAAARPGASGATTCPRPSSARRPSPAPCARIGGSRTACTGCSASSSATTSPACAPATARRTWPWSSTWP